MDQGYMQSRWDNHLVRRYLKERHGIDIGRAQLINWLHTIFLKSVSGNFDGYPPFRWYSILTEDLCVIY